MNVAQVIEQLDAQIATLQRVRSVLTGGEVRAAGITSGGRRRRHMSAEARARIAAGQRARWARVKGAQKKKK